MSSKKSFKENPALQFISAPETEETQNTDYTDTTHNTDITQTADTTPYTDHEPAEAERKTKRLNLLVQPSTLQAFAKIAHMKRSSVNDLINTVLKDYTEANSKLIEKYDSIFDGSEEE